MRGFQARLSETAGLAPQYISDIIHRRRMVSVKQAKRLEAASVQAGKKIPWTDWIDPDTKNEFFDRSGNNKGSDLL